MSATILLAVAAVGAAVSWLGVALVRDIAVRRGLFDLPNERSSHARPTPRIGGLGIVAAIVTATGVAAMLGQPIDTAPAILALGLAVALVSLIDDLRGLPALARLAVHLAAGAAAIASLGPLDVIRDLAVVDPRTALRLDQGLTVLWIAGFMNAFNFMDGIDGIAGGQGAVAGAATAGIGWLVDVPALAVLGTAQAAACLGFLWHNRPPATIFMGDAGSAFLGFLIAVAPIAAPTTAAPPYGVFTFAVVAWPFLFDTTLTFLRRAARGENVVAAHRTHLYQRLTQAGWSHLPVAALYTALAAIAALLVVASPARGRVTGPAIVFVAVSAAVLWSLVIYVERQRLGHRSPAAGPVEDSPRA